MSYNELNSHKKSDKIKWIVAFTLIAVLLLGMAMMIVTNVRQNEEKPNEESPAVEQVAAQNDFAMQPMSTSKIRLMSAGVATVAEDSSVSKTLVATVLPATAENKLVDWSVAWADSSNTANISEYITVTPSSGGSTTATVTCKRAFTGNAVVTVTTRENGYTADCVVTFVGIPTDITINGDISPASGVYNTGIGDTYTFNVAVTNPFNQVGANYQNVTATVNGVGSVVLGTYQSTTGSGSTWYDESDKTVTLDSLKDNFISISFENNVLSITTVKSIESYYGKLERIDGGRTRYYTDKFRSYVDECYFNVTLTESNSGLSKTMKIVFDDSVVTGVSINSSDLTF